MDNSIDINHKEWKGTTGGSLWMHKLLIWSFKWINIRVFYLCMALIIPFYMIFSHKGYISMYHFFRERLKYPVLKSFVNVYLNHYKFGQIILDRFAAYSGKSFRFKIVGKEEHDSLMQEEEGFVQLSSHVGNYELAGYSVRSERKCINALVFANEVESVMNNRSRMLGKNNMKMIPVKQDFSHLFLMNNALADGQVVSIPADRIFGSSKCVECNFFDSKAKFPVGPFMLAVQRDVPVIAIFVMKESTNNYTVHFRRITCSGAGSGVRDRIAGLAQDFADNLCDIVKAYPTQWFNYFEFWDQVN